MRVNLSGHHVVITPALRSYVERKFARVVRHFDRLIDLQCILTVEKLRHKAESTIQVRGTRIYADAVEDDMYAAIDALADKLDRRVRKHKEKRGDHHAMQARRQGLALSP
jgi:putative sigma-54 modulation protein